MSVRNPLWTKLCPQKKVTNRDINKLVSPDWEDAIWRFLGVCLWGSKGHYLKCGIDTVLSSKDSVNDVKVYTKRRHCKQNIILNVIPIIVIPS